MKQEEVEVEVEVEIEQPPKKPNNDEDGMVEIPINSSSDNYVDISIPPSPIKSKENLLGPQIDQAFQRKQSLDNELLFTEKANIANPTNLQRKKSPILPFRSHQSSCLGSHGEKIPVQIP